jgi:hypothetical protein
MKKVVLTCEQNFAHAKQDQDHGSRRPRSQWNAPSKYRRMSDLSGKGTNKKKWWASNYVTQPYMFTRLISI